MSTNLGAIQFDKHTQTGKAAIRQLLRENPEVRDCISDFVPEFRALAVAEMAAFYVDAISVKHRLSWKQSKSLHALGLRTDMMKIGTPEKGIVAIVGAVSSSIDHLNDIRCRLRQPSRQRQLHSETTARGSR